MDDRELDARELKELNDRFASLSPLPLLRWILDRYPGSVALASSLGPEDLLLTHLLAQTGRPAQVFVLDTGRLHEESYETLERCRQLYGSKLSFEIYFPKSEALERMVKEKGLFSFYESLENRHECCAIRKVEPLGRALAGLKAWVSGLRRQQLATRTEIALIERDLAHGGILKLNPLANWSWDDLQKYITQEQVLVNPLQKRGYTSIGCAPCTRAIQPGEDIRAGRWWWETAADKECGLHLQLNEQNLQLKEQNLQLKEQNLQLNEQKAVKQK